MELRHFGHEHPLILNEQKIEDGERVACNACLQLITGSAYRCTNCYFYLHKLCAKLPTEMKHPMHPEHPLSLFPQAPYDNMNFICDACDKDLIAFTYHCSLCQFDLDISCALRVQSVEHENHAHPLSPVFSPASFECHACHTKREGISFMCNICTFWIHEDCASPESYTITPPVPPQFEEHTSSSQVLDNTPGRGHSGKVKFLTYWVSPEACEMLENVVHVNKNTYTNFKMTSPILQTVMLESLAALLTSLSTTRVFEIDESAAQLAVASIGDYEKVGLDLGWLKQRMVDAKKVKKHEENVVLVEALECRLENAQIEVKEVEERLAMSKKKMRELEEWLAKAKQGAMISSQELPSSLEIDDLVLENIV